MTLSRSLRSIASQLSGPTREWVRCAARYVEASVVPNVLESLLAAPEDELRHAETCGLEFDHHAAAQLLPRVHAFARDADAGLAALTRPEFIHAES